MNLLSKNRIIEADLKVFTLLDIVNRLKEENFFNDESSFHLIKVVSENHLVLSVPSSKLTPRQIHELKYLDTEKRILIKSKYQNILFPSFLMYGMLLIIMALGGKELIQEEWKMFASMMLGITLFISIITLTSLNWDSKNIEREILIRLNYLLRQKGYKIPL